jgi:hypothetical protein
LGLLVEAHRADRRSQTQGDDHDWSGEGPDRSGTDDGTRKCQRHHDGGAEPKVVLALAHACYIGTSDGRV